MFEIKKIDPEVTYGFRHIFLRPNQTIEDCKLDTDHTEGSFHLGAYYHEKLISIASFCKEIHPDFPIAEQYRLRAMATHENFRNRGAGSTLVYYAEDYMIGQGINFLWCKGRTNVQGYYNKLGFHAHGEAFDYPPIGLHIIMFKMLQ